MKYLLIIFLLTCYLSTHSQEITTSITANNKGVAAQLYYQEMFKEGGFIFGPRVGITYHPLNPNASHFYWQNIIEYKGFFFSPFWLRSYNKTIGYQIPTTIGYMTETKIAIIEVWGNYIYHAKSFDLHIVVSPKKRLKFG